MTHVGSFTPHFPAAAKTIDSRHPEWRNGKGSIVTFLDPAHANLSQKTQPNALSAAPSLGVAGLSRLFWTQSALALKKKQQKKKATSRTVTKNSDKMFCQHVPLTVTCCVCLSGATTALSQRAMSMRNRNILVSSHHSSTSPLWGKLSSSQWVIRS